MLKALFRPISQLVQSVRLGRTLQYSRYIKDLGDSDFGDRSFIKLHIKRPLHKHSVRSQTGLFHGKEAKSGNRYCFSDKRFRRKVKVNSHKKEYFSDLLGAKLDILVSTKAMRTIKKYGSLDNYILLTKEHNLKSIYGEYLREMMLRKLNDPNFVVKDFLCDPHHAVHMKKKGKKYTKYAHKFSKFIWHPPEIRHTDLSHSVERPEELIPLKDRKKYEEIKQKLLNKEDINFDDDYVKQLRTEREQDMVGSEALKKEAEANYKKAFPTRNLRRKYEEYLKEAKESSKFPIDMF